MRDEVIRALNRLRGVALTADEVEALKEILGAGTMHQMFRPPAPKLATSIPAQDAIKCLVDLGVPEDELNRLIVSALLAKKK